MATTLSIIAGLYFAVGAFFSLCAWSDGFKADAFWLFWVWPLYGLQNPFIIAAIVCTGVGTLAWWLARLVLRKFGIV